MYWPEPNSAVMEPILLAISTNITDIRTEQTESDREEGQTRWVYWLSRT